MSGRPTEVIDMQQISLFDYFPQLSLRSASGKERTTEGVQAPTSHLSGKSKQYAYDCGEELKGAKKHLTTLVKFSDEWQKVIEGAYWKRDHELFARAFESWIEDELVERGITNSYLVTGTRLPGPYPEGDERKSINDAFRKWWKVLSDSEVLHNKEFWN